MKNNRKVCACLPHGGSAAVGCLSMRAGSMGRENHCGHQVWPYRSQPWPRIKSVNNTRS